MRSRGTHGSGTFTRVLLAVGLLLGLVVTTSGTASAGTSVPSFSKFFAPDPIGPGSSSTLTFTITNGSTTVTITDLAFTDVLPAGVAIADAPAVVNECNGTVSAPAGGSTISLSGGTIGTSTSCDITVNVTDVSGSPGTRTNTSGDLTSSEGNSGTATADLNIDTGLPGFSKSFSPSTVPFGGRSTLTFTIDNSANGGSSTLLNFEDDLPAGMTVADPSNKATTCANSDPAQITAVPGSSTIVFDSFDGATALAANSTCTVSVDVVGGAVGSLENVSDSLQENNFSTVDEAGLAAATLDVNAIGGDLEILKDFTDDPVPPGGAVTLEFTITNRNRDFAATDIAFSDDLDATLTGLTATGAVGNTCGGMATSPFPTSNFSYDGGSLAAEASCTVTIQLLVPGDAPNGSFPNTSDNVTGTVDGSPVTGNQAGDTLFVTSFPILTKEFTDDPVGSGQTVDLEFTIVNPEDDSVMSDITFEDVFDEILQTASSVPADGFCGPGSTATFTPLSNPVVGSTTPASLLIENANLAAAGDPGDFCTFTITLDVTPGAAAGAYPNTTSEIEGTLDDLPGAPSVTGPPASDDVVVIAAPQVAKEFTDDPVTPGSTVTLTFTLDNLDPDNAATDIAFTDDLGALNLDGDSNPATDGGLEATTEDFNDCGATVDISTDPSIIDVSGGSLAAGASCTITLTLSVPSATAGGTFENETTVPTATVAGVTASAAPAIDDLIVTGLVIDKEFLDDPAIAGGTVDLQFTIDNQSGSNTTSITFKDDLANGLSPNLPVDTSACGGGSSLSESNPAGPVDSRLTFAGGELTAGTSCSFTVTLDLDPSMADDTYPNATFEGFAFIGGVPANLASATDELVVNSTLIDLSKEFTDDPANPGGNVTLEFTVENLDPANSLSALAFQDDLGAALAGLTIASVDLDDCGGTPSGVGTDLFDYSGGTLAAGATCTIRLTLDVPAGPFAGNTFVNTTTAPTGSVTGLAVDGDPATDTLRIRTVEFTKTFDGPTTPTGTAQLTFDIVNLDSSSGVSQLSFFDNLGNVVPGMFASGLPPAPCGASSTLTGSSVLTMTGGELGPGGSCSFAVTVNVPDGAAPGDFLNTTSNLTSAGLFVADPAAAFLTIEPPPTFAKSFSPNPINAGEVSALTFLIDNSASSLAATNLAFTDNLPAGLVIATPPNPVDGCGGTLTAPAGGGTIDYTGGTVGAGVDCTIGVDVTSADPGNYDNVSGNLTSSSGTSGTASDTLVVDLEADLAIFKVGDPTATAGETVTYSLTVDNLGPSDATNVTVVDTAPPGMMFDSATVPCTPGVPGPGQLTCDLGTIPAGGSSGVFEITFAIDPAAPPGVVTNEATVSSDAPDPDTSDNTATADTEIVVEADLAISKVDDVDPAVAGETVTYTITVENFGPSDATNVTVVDTAPAGMMFDSATAPCTPGVPGPGQLTCDLGTIAAGFGALFDVTFAIDPAAPEGDVDNVVDVTSDATDPFPADNTATETTTIVAEADLAITKADDVDPAVAGTDVTYTITVDNFGPSEATNVTVVDTAPAGMMYLSDTDSCTPGVPGPGQLTCDLGTIPAGSGATFDVTFSIDPGATAGPVVNEASVSSDATDPDTSDNTASETTTIAPPAPPDFSKEFDPDIISKGDSSTLTFTIDNSASTGTASDLDFTDDLPADVVIDTPSDATTDCTGGTLTAPDGGSTISYTGGEVGPGAVCTVSVDVTSNVVGDHVNVSNALTSTSGNSGAATDTLTVVETQPFTTVDGKRYADTRLGGFTFDGLFQGAGKRPAGTTYEVLIAGRGAVPVDATGAIINLTSVDSNPPPGFFTAFDCDSGMPTASALNYVAGVDVANEIFVQLSATGSVCVFTFSASHILVDVVGFVQEDDTTQMIDAARLAESREGAPTVDGVMAGFGRTAPGSTTTVQVTGRAGVPADAKSVIVNVAAVDPDDTGFLSVFPCTPGLTPTTSTINYVDGVNRANQVIAEVNAAGEICIYTDTDIDLIVDVFGYVEADSTLMMFGPERFVDTRGGATVDGQNSGGGPLAPGQTYEVQVTGRDGVPADADVVVANVLAVDPLEDGFFTVTGCVTPTPNASSLNYVPGVNGANELVVELSADGKICIFTSGATDVIVDVVGFVPDQIT